MTSRASLVADLNCDLRRPTGRRVNLVNRLDAVAGVQLAQRHDLYARSVNSGNDFPEKGEWITRKASWLGINLVKGQNKRQVMGHRLVDRRQYLGRGCVTCMLALPVARILDLEACRLPRVPVRIGVRAVRGYLGKLVEAADYLGQRRVRRPFGVHEPVGGRVEPVVLEPHRLMDDVGGIRGEMVLVVVLLDRIGALLSLIDHVPAPVILQLLELGHIEVVLDRVIDILADDGHIASHPVLMQKARRRQDRLGAAVEYEYQLALLLRRYQGKSAKADRRGGSARLLGDDLDLHAVNPGPVESGRRSLPSPVGAPLTARAQEQVYPLPGLAPGVGVQQVRGNPRGPVIIGEAQPQFIYSSEPGHPQPQDRVLMLEVEPDGVVHDPDRSPAARRQSHHGVAGAGARASR